MKKAVEIRCPWCWKRIRRRDVRHVLEDGRTIHAYRCRTEREGYLEAVAGMAERRVAPAGGLLGKGRGAHYRKRDKRDAKEVR